MRFNQYPTDSRGLVVPSSEFFTPYTHRPNRINNHHMWFTARTMSRFLITQTLRDLDAYQEQIPVTTHDWVHSEYEPPRIPVMSVLMDRLDEAHETGEQLRKGSAHHPLYEPFTDERWTFINKEYSQLRGQVA